MFGILVLIAGLVVAWPYVRSRCGFDKLIALGCVFYAAPLATFSAEHLFNAKALAQLVPPWMPARLFWAYLVGVALLAAALSLAFKRYVRWSSLLLAIMFGGFVVMLHIPNVIETHAKLRLFWVLVGRDFSFGAAALALFATQLSDRPLAERLIFAVRISLGVILVYYGVQHILHPEFAPGVPLTLRTPAWVPMPLAFAYLVGGVLVICGVALIFNWLARGAAIYVGLVMTLLTLLLFTPILVMARGVGPVLVGINYVADTLLYGAAMLLLADALPRRA